MPITERTLKKWRREALLVLEALEPQSDDLNQITRFRVREYMNKVIKMTQELLDQHLIRKE